MGFKSFLSICIAFLIAISCQDLINGEENGDFFEKAKKVDFEPLEQGFFGNVDEQNLVIRSEQRFKEFWSSLYSSRKPLPDIPKIDFSKDMLIVSVMDTKPHGGYVVEITQVGLFDGKIGVKVRNKNPGKNCGAIMALTTPFHIVKIDKSDKSIAFFEEKAIVDCGE